MDLFRSLVPEDDRVTVRPMFGNISAFVNGNMFFGVFGSDLFVRLSSEDRLDLLRNKGSSMLEPMKGKPMKDYVVLPENWRVKPETLRSWISKSLEWSSKLPPKKAKN
jgi:TfoX/Sxy family transcriptional regulator of competence genes